MENKFVYLLLTVVLLGSIVVFRAGLVPRNFDSLEDAFELYNKCEVSLAVEGEKSVMALGVKDGVTIRDFFYKKNDKKVKNLQKPIDIFIFYVKMGL